LWGRRKGELQDDREMKNGERRRGGDDVARCAKGAIRKEKNRNCREHSMPSPPRFPQLHNRRMGYTVLE
jgi:hypothetical protein